MNQQRFSSLLGSEGAVVGVKHTATLAADNLQKHNVPVCERWRFFISCALNSVETLYEKGRAGSGGTFKDCYSSPRAMLCIENPKSSFNSVSLFWCFKDLVCPRCESGFIEEVTEDTR